TGYKYFRVTGPNVDLANKAPYDPDVAAQRADEHAGNFMFNRERQVDYLAAYPINAVCEPSPSSWGDGGYSAVWVDGSNDWIYRHVHRAEARMHELAQRHKDGADGLLRRALNQAARELLLAESSDWAFIMKTGTAVRYAVDRVKAHLARFRRLDREITSGRIDEGWIVDLERRD